MHRQLTPPASAPWSRRFAYILAQKPDNRKSAQDKFRQLEMNLQQPNPHEPRYQHLATITSGLYYLGTIRWNAYAAAAQGSGSSIARYFPILFCRCPLSRSPSRRSTMMRRTRRSNRDRLNTSFNQDPQSRYSIPPFSHILQIVAPKPHTSILRPKAILRTSVPIS